MIRPPASAAALPPGPEGPGAEAHGWTALRQLVLARLLVASLALPFGLLLRPEVTPQPAWLLTLSLAGLAVLSVAYAAGIRARRGQTAQAWLQLGGDLAFVTYLAAMTGARDSQFVLFYALVVITGGVLMRVAGGVAMSAGACLGFLALPALARAFGAPQSDAIGTLPRPELLATFLTMVGVLAGVLGERVHRAVGALERTTRELDRVRVDNDVILRHLATGVFTVDEGGVVAYLNPAAEQVLGVLASELRGRPVGEALPARLSALRDLVLEAVRLARGRARVELRVQSAAGRTLPLGASTNVLMHEDRLTGVVAVFQDLTEVREMERRMRRSETLAEVGALAAGIAHELRNGLKPIAGSVEVLQRELRLDGESAELMDLIARESARLNKFISDLLAYSRERELTLDATDLANHLRELVATLARDPRRGEAVTVTLEGGEPVSLPLDREQMRQVWLNLAVNALEAMGARGTLTLRWRLQPGGQVVVEFEDDGPGIAAADLSRVGEPFFTTKRGGTGLGLAIAQRIVERHGGVLTLDSGAGRGTRARVQLPGAGVALAQAA